MSYVKKEVQSKAEGFDDFFESNTLFRCFFKVFETYDQLKKILSFFIDKLFPNN